MVKLEGDMFVSEGRLCFAGHDQDNRFFGGIPLETILRAKIPELKNGTVRTKTTFLFPIDQEFHET